MPRQRPRYGRSPEGSTSFDTDTGTPTTQRIQVRSDGVTPVIIDMTASGLKGINGFDLIRKTPVSLKIDIGTASSAVENGFLPFQADAETIERTQHYFASCGALNSEIEFLIGGATRVIDRGAASYPALPAVAQDWIGETGDTMITLAGLSAGTYGAITYHHEPGGQSGTYDILVNGVSKVTGHSHSTGTGVAPSAASFSFDTDGSNPVVITLQRTGGSFSLINGLELTLTAPYEEPPLVISSASLEAGRINLTIDATGLQTSQVQRTFFLESNDWQTVTTIVIDSSSVLDGATKVTGHSHSTGTGISPSSASFSFDTDGSHPVVITLQRTGGSFSLINGLELTLTAPYEEPPLLISSASLEAGRINLTIDATGLRTSQVQRTFFLESNDWQTVTTIVTDGSSVLWSEPINGLWECVFYRIISE